MIDRSISICNDCIFDKCVWRTTGEGIDPPIMKCEDFKPNELTQKLDEMDRLTKPGGSYCDECDVHAGPYATCYMKGCDDEIAMYTRLAAYEDAEEQGRLIVLPCKLGDTVYIVVGSRIHEAKVRHFWYDKKGLVISAVYQFIGPCVYSGKWGKTVFLTRKEAETALGGDTQC